MLRPEPVEGHGLSGSVPDWLRQRGRPPPPPPPSPASAAPAPALARLGAVLLPLNTRLAPAELAFQLQDAAARHLVADAAHFDVVTELGGELPSVRLHRLAELNGAASGQAAAPRRHASGFDLGDVQTVVYTSGTTGRPKGAQLTYGNHLWSALASALNLGLREDDRWLACQVGRAPV